MCEFTRTIFSKKTHKKTQNKSNTCKEWQCLASQHGALGSWSYLFLNKKQTSLSYASRKDSECSELWGQLWAVKSFLSLKQHQASPGTPKKITGEFLHTNPSPRGEIPLWVNRPSLFYATCFPFYMIIWRFIGSQSRANDESQHAAHLLQLLPGLVLCPGQCEERNSCEFNKTLKLKGIFPGSCYAFIVHSRWLSRR